MPRGVPMSWMESLYEYPPVFAATGSGSRFRDVDGQYVDMYLGDLSAFCGHAPRQWWRRSVVAWPPATTSCFPGRTR